MPLNPNPSKKRTAIIAIGNPLMGDDGAGIAALEMLREGELPEGVELIDMGTGGLSLLHLLAELEIAIILDAVDFGGTPGDVRVFQHSEARTTKELSSLSLHDCDVMEVLSLARRLGQCPDRVVICAIQPAEMAPGTGLSPQVKGSLPLLAELSLEELRGSLSV